MHSEDYIISLFLDIGEPLYKHVKSTERCVDNGAICFLNTQVVLVYNDTIVYWFNFTL